MTKKEFKILIKECIFEVLVENVVDFSKYKDSNGSVKWEYLDKVATMFPSEYSVEVDAYDSESVAFDFHTRPWLKAVEGDGQNSGKYYLINYDGNEKDDPLGIFTIEELYKAITSNKYAKPLGKRNVQ